LILRSSVVTVRNCSANLSMPSNYKPDAQAQMRRHTRGSHCGVFVEVRYGEAQKKR